MAGNEEIICLSRRKSDGNAYKMAGNEEIICLSPKQSDGNAYKMAGNRRSYSRINGKVSEDNRT